MSDETPYGDFHSDFHLAMMKVTGAFQKSTVIMKESNSLIKLPQFNETMRAMSAEMMKVCSLYNL